MINLIKASKEILLKKNEDGTYNMIAKVDLINDDGSFNSEAQLNYPKVKINRLDAEALAANDTIFEVETKA